MKFDFTSKNRNHADSFTGGFEEMLQTREKQLPEIESGINEVLKGYTGETIAIIRIIEDENGKPEETVTGIFGVGGLHSQLALGKGLGAAQKKLAHVIAKAAEGDDKTRRALIEHLADELIKKTED